MKFSMDALTEWARVLTMVLEYHGPRQIIVPVVRYEPGTDSDGGVNNVFLDPIVVNRGTVTTAEDLRHHLDNQLMRRFGQHEEWANEDVALSTNVFCVRVADSPKVEKLDIIDVEPGHVFHPSEVMFHNAYVLIRTGGSYHLYPKARPLSQSGGHVVQDVRWERGFIRVSESSSKGALIRVSP